MYKGKLLSPKSYQARYWNEYAQTMPRDKLDGLHMKRIKFLLNYAYNNSRFYRQLYDRNGVKPEDISSLDDFKQKVPLTDKPMVQPTQRIPDLPYGDITACDDSLIQAHYQTSGTTGEPLLEGWEDYAVQRIGASWCPAWWDVGIRPDDIFYFAFDFGAFAGFWSALWGAIRFGAKVISGAGVAMTSEERVRQIIRLKPTVLVCTPTYAFRLADVAREMGIDPAATSIKFHSGAGEPGPVSIPELKKRIEESWGCKTCEVLGISEIPTAAPSCIMGDGIHEHEMNQFAWVRDPGTGNEVAEGEVGERIITCFSNFATPFINYRTHDLVRPYYSCPCGSTWLFYKNGVLGRTDYMVTIRGTNVYQTAVENIIGGLPEASSYYQLILTREKNVDNLTIRLELKRDIPREKYESIASRLRTEIRIRLGVTLSVEVVPPDTLPRYEVKTKRLIDKRPNKYKTELARKNINLSHQGGV